MSALAAPPPMVVITVEEAQSIQDSLADVHCWICGFLAARPDAEIPGAHRLRDQIALLRRDIARAQGKPNPEKEMPF